jgi:hypothetical protein
MRRLVLASLILLTGNYLACSDGVSHRDGWVIKNQFDQVMTLRVGEMAYYLPEGMKIGFVQTIHDSRCPMDAYCLVAGGARIQLLLIKSGYDTAVVTPAITGNGVDSASIDSLSIEALGYRVSLLQLDPYPQDLEPPHPDEYAATIEVAALNGNGHQESVIITDIPPDSILLDPYWLDGIEVSGNMLYIAVRYGGGCKPHDFELFMSPAAFMESDPVQANLYLRHDSNGDMCEAIISEPLAFDVSAIAALFVSQYPGAEGRVLLNMHELVGDDYTSHQSVLYTF